MGRMRDQIENPPSIAVLIVTWNRRADVLECIGSVCASDYPGDRLRIYVVDNGSSDDTSSEIEAKYPEVRLIKCAENLGFAGGNNVGLNRVLQGEAEAVFLLNDDALVEQGAIRFLAEAAFVDESLGVTAPKILLHSDPTVIWSAGGLVDRSSGVATQRYYGEPDDGRGDAPCDLDYAVGCAALVKRRVIEEVGFLDPRFYLYYEETDWCRRIRDAGYRIRYIPESRVMHKVSLSNNGRNNASYYYARNRLLYLKNAGASGIELTGTAMSLLKSAAAHAVKGRRQTGRLMFRGISDFCEHKFGKLCDV